MKHKEYCYINSNVGIPKAQKDESYCRCHSMKIKIGVPIDQYNLRWETHKIISVEENPNNKLVPFSFETCCGKFIPTSAADGHFEHLGMGGWELV